MQTWQMSNLRYLCFPFSIMYKSMEIQYALYEAAFHVYIILLQYLTDIRMLLINTCSNFLFKHCTSFELEKLISNPGDIAYTNDTLFSVAASIRPVRLSETRSSLLENQYLVPPTCYKNVQGFLIWLENIQ
jgi:hypothetical protein